MTIALLVVALIAILALVAGLVVVTVQARTSPGPSLVNRTLVIHTHDGQTIRGLLENQHADRWTLREAEYERTETDGGNVPLDGLAHIPVATISWVQEIYP